MAPAWMLFVAAFLQDPLEGKKPQDRPTVVAPTESEPRMAPVGSVIVISREEIQKQAALTHDWGKILAHVVPGLASSSETISNAGQTMRGTIISILMDGVPQSAPLRNGQRDLKIIDPSAVERIEIWTLPTSLYGYGATLSVINFITKKTGEGKPRLATEVGTGFSLSHGAESIRGRLSQQISGKDGKVGYAFGGSWEAVNSFFDAEGNRISPSPHTQGGLPDSMSVNLFGKLTLDLEARQRVEFGLNYFDTKQDTDFVTIAGIAGQRKTKSTESRVPGKDPSTENLFVDVAYRHPDCGGHRIEAQYFFQEYRTRFAFSPFFPGGGQSMIESLKTGGRIFVDSPVLDSVRLGWGTDYQSDRTAQPLEDGRDFAPFMEQGRCGVLAQLEASIGERVVLRGGVRQEFITVQVDDYRTLFGGNFVEGGGLYFDPTLWNAGAEVRVDSRVTLFIAFAQGFTIADIGLDLQTTTAPSVRAFDPDGQRSDSFELGVRLRSEGLAGSIVLFYSETDDGITFGPPPAFAPLRLPERVYGIEVSAQAELAEAWAVGISWLWMEGEKDRDKDGEMDTYLPGYRVPPIKVTARIDYRTLPGWTNRIQLLYVADRDRFGGGSMNFGEGRVESYVLFGLVSTIEVGEGRLTVAVENALNENYFPVLSQVANVGRFYTAGEGAVLRVSYSKEW